MVYDKLFNSSFKLKVLMVFAVPALLTLVSQQAQAQGASTPGGSCVPLGSGQACLDKTASPYPGVVGQPLNFTITFTND
jgi:hypothetical protein